MSGHRNEQLFVTIDHIKNWKYCGKRFSVEYESARVTTEGEPHYRCKYTLDDTGMTYTLAAQSTARTMSDVRFVRDRSGVIRHHREFGDGRDLIFDQDLEVYMI